VGFLEQQEPVVKPDLSDQQVQRDQPDPLDPPGIQAYKVPQDLQVILVLRDQPEFQDL